MLTGAGQDRGKETESKTTEDRYASGLLDAILESYVALKWGWAKSKKYYSKGMNALDGMKQISYPSEDVRYQAILVNVLTYAEYPPDTTLLDEQRATELMGLIVPALEDKFLEFFQNEGGKDKNKPYFSKQTQKALAHLKTAISMKRSFSLQQKQNVVLDKKMDGGAPSETVVDSDDHVLLTAEALERHNNTQGVSQAKTDKQTDNPSVAASAAPSAASTVLSDIKTMFSESADKKGESEALYCYALFRDWTPIIITLNSMKSDLPKLTDDQFEHYKKMVIAVATTPPKVVNRSAPEWKAENDALIQGFGFSEDINGKIKRRRDRLITAYGPQLDRVDKEFQISPEQRLESMIEQIENRSGVSFLLDDDRLADVLETIRPKPQPKIPAVVESTTSDERDRISAAAMKQAGFLRPAVSAAAEEMKKPSLLVPLEKPKGGCVLS